MPDQLTGTWSTKTPGLQLAVDATSLAKFVQSPAAYNYGIRQGYRRKGSREHIDFGHLYHGCLEVRDAKLLSGSTHEQALHAAIDHAFEIGLEQKDGPKTLHSLVRTLVWYSDDQERAGDTAVLPYAFPDGTPAVEVSWRVPLPFWTHKDEQFLLCGHFDRLCTFGGDIFIGERKTTHSMVNARYMARYAPNVQVDTYGLGGYLAFPHLKIKGVLVEACQVGVNFSRFMTQPFYHTPARRDEMLGWIGETLQEMEKCAEAQYWPCRRECNAFGNCDFGGPMGICATSRTMRERFLKHSGEFVMNPLDPMVMR